MTRAVDDEVVSDDGVGVSYADPVPALRTAEDVVQADVGHGPSGDRDGRVGMQSVGFVVGTGVLQQKEGC